MQGIALDSGHSAVNRVNIVDLTELKSVWMGDDMQCADESTIVGLVV